MEDLKGKVAIVTGAFTGIGKEITKLLIANGVIVVGTGRNNKNALELQKELEEKYIVKKVKKDTNEEKQDDADITKNKDISSLFIYHLGDITKNETIKSVVDLTINKFGRIDILVNNAGIIDRFNTIHNMTDELWDYILKVNITGPMKLIREVLPYMIKQKNGSIINMGSIASINGGRGGLGYVSSKHALLGLTKNTAQAYGRKNIRCNLVAPSFSLTGILKPNKGIKIRGVAITIRGLKSGFKIIKKQDIAKVVLFLASDKSKFINGTSIVIDGGWSAY